LMESPSILHPEPRKTTKGTGNSNRHGITCVERYDSKRCFQEPMQVVTEFLDILAKGKQ